jgi:hypothetical protein
MSLTAALQPTPWLFERICGVLTVVGLLALLIAVAVTL